VPASNQDVMPASLSFLSCYSCNSPSGSSKCPNPSPSCAEITAAPNLLNQLIRRQMPSGTSQSWTDDPFVTAVTTAAAAQALSEEMTDALIMVSTTKPIGHPGSAPRFWSATHSLDGCRSLGQLEGEGTLGEFNLCLGPSERIGFGDPFLEGRATSPLLQL
jgi:hypothetical protein